MRTYEEIWETARTEQPFSNSTDGDYWFANWCEHPCANDSEELVAKGEGCPLILVALEGRTPAEWLDHNAASRTDRYHCIEFRSEDDGPGEPQPIPDPPNQPALFPRDKFEGPRMFADSVPRLEVSS